MKVLSLSQYSGIISSILSKCVQEMIHKPMKCVPHTHTQSKENKRLGRVWGGSVVVLAIVVLAGSGTWPEAHGSDVRKTLCAIRRVIMMSTLPPGS